MAYVKNIIGKNERLLGIARLHWIYLAKGLTGFLFCLAAGMAIDMAVFRILSALHDMAPKSSNDMMALTGLWITPISAIIGGFYFFLYFLKVVYTEIALTETRVIHKSGFIFVKIEEIDIEEISAENMDMGYFGSFLGYAYIMLDCRFVGDVRLPAIGKATQFVKALHNARMKVVPMFPDANRIAQALVNELPENNSSDEKPQHEMLKPAEPKPYEPPRDENGDIIQKDDEEKQTDTSIAASADHEKEKELLELQIAKLELEVKLKEAEAVATAETTTTETSTEEKNGIQNQHHQPMAPATPPAPSAPPATAAGTINPAINPVATVTAAKAQSEMPEMTKMPQITDKIAEELIAQGLIPHPDEIKPESQFDEERPAPTLVSEENRLEPTKADPLIHDFAISATVVNSSNNGELKPAPAL